MRKRNKEKQLTSWGKHRSKEEIPLKKKKKGGKEEKQVGVGNGGREEKEDTVKCGTGEQWKLYLDRCEKFRKSSIIQKLYK